MKRIISIFGFVALAALASFGQATFTVQDLLNVKRFADPQVSPDGRWVAYTVGTVDKAANKVVNQIYVMPSTAAITGSFQTGFCRTRAPAARLAGKAPA